jgi:hypothetical protein
VRPANLTAGKWTEETDNLLRELVAKKATKSEIMVAFPSKTYNAIYLRMYRLAVDSDYLSNQTKRGGSSSITVSKPKCHEVERKCMTCGTPFMSSGPGNRLCMIHRRENDDGTFTVKGR